VYSLGGGGNNHNDKLTASGVTVFGEEEKVPVAANSIRVPLVVLLMAMDWRCRPPLQHVRTDTQTKSRRSRARNRFMAVFLSVIIHPGARRGFVSSSGVQKIVGRGTGGLGKHGSHVSQRRRDMGVPALTNGST